MPRATRAALRAQEIAEDAAAIALPPTPTKDRVPLGEISDNVTTKTTMAVIESLDDIGSKAAAKGKKSKGAKKGKKQLKPKAASQEIEILEDDHHSSQSDAVDEACEDLSNNVSEYQHTVLSDRALTPPSPAVDRAIQQLSPRETPQSDPDNQAVGSSTKTGSNEVMDTTCGGTLEAPSSDIMISRQMNVMSQASDMPGEAKDDLFVQQIKVKTPAKRVSRIEDSVEALDALEDEIERIGQAIPATSSDLSSPTIGKKHARPTAKVADKKSNTSLKATNTLSSISKAERLPSDPKPAARKSSVRSSFSSSKPSTTRITQRKDVVAPRSPPSTRNPAPGTSAPQSKRVSSIYKPPFQTVKSTKAPTKSTFELPGEAITRKLKEQREERQKREQQEQDKQRKFKACPVRVSQAPQVRLTASTRARLSLAQNAPADDSVPKAVLRTGTASTVGTSDRRSSLTVANRRAPAPVKKPASPSANIAVKRAPSLSASTMSRQPSNSAPSAKELVHQKLKGKEVFGRTKVALSERENDKRGKEEAAKKARADAAERGRIASREWAEKQKARKMAALKAKGSEEAQINAA